MFLIYDQITRAATTHRIRIRKLENESSCVVCIDCNIIVISGENVLLEKNLPRLNLSRKINIDDFSMLYIYRRIMLQRFKKGSMNGASHSACL